MKPPANKPGNGWNPDLVFLSVVFSNSTNLAVVIPSNSVLEISFAK